MFLSKLILAALALIVVSLRAAENTPPPSRLVGMYIHQHWPYNHPYAARTWTLEDWRGYADGLKKLGYNAMLIWPMLETMPDPLTPSDEAYLAKIKTVIDMLHTEMEMRVYVVLCANTGCNNEEAAKATFENRHFFSSDIRVNPGDPAAMKRLTDWRAKLLAPLATMDGVAIIDSDPTGYPGSTNEEFVDLLVGHRKMLDTLRPNIELYYWMHAGWAGYGRFYETGVLSFSTDEENTDILKRLIAKNPEPWGLANGLKVAEKLRIADRVISFNYGRIEAEPSFPMTNFGGVAAYEGGSSPGPRGVMANAQTHCVQLPNTFAFARGAQGRPVTESDYVGFAEDLIPGMGTTIARSWKALAGTDPNEMRKCATELTSRANSSVKTGPLKGLLFGDPQRFLHDLTAMLRLRSAFETLRLATDHGGSPKKELVEFIDAAQAWQHQTGYENTWTWPGLSDVLRKLGSAEVNAVLDSQYNPFVAPELRTGEKPFQYIARKLREEESYTPRLLQALEATRLPTE